MIRTRHAADDRIPPAPCSAPDVAPLYAAAEQPSPFGGDADLVAWLAEQVCGPCPYRDGCLADGLADPHSHGLWGGILLPLPHRHYRHRSAA